MRNPKWIKMDDGSGLIVCCAVSGDLRLDHQIDQAFTTKWHPSVGNALRRRRSQRTKLFSRSAPRRRSFKLPKPRLQRPRAQRWENNSVTASTASYFLGGRSIPTLIYFIYFNLFCLFSNPSRIPLTSMKLVMKSNHQIPMMV